MGEGGRNNHPNSKDPYLLQASNRSSSGGELLGDPNKEIKTEQEKGPADKSTKSLLKRKARKHRRNLHKSHAIKERAPPETKQKKEKTQKISLWQNVPIG